MPRRRIHRAGIHQPMRRSDHHHVAPALLSSAGTITTIRPDLLHDEPEPELEPMPEAEAEAEAQAEPQPEAEA